MLRSSGKNSTLLSGPSPGLLPWQLLLLVLIIGLFTPWYPLPSLCTASLLFVSCWSTIKRLAGALTAFSAVFALGLALSAGGFFRLNQGSPAWDHAHQDIEIQASIHSVSPRPDNRLRIILEEIRFKQPGLSDLQTLPGRCVWKWQDPPFWPGPGQTVHGAFRLKPIHGRQNFGTWDIRAYWGRLGVRYRTYTEGAATDFALVGQTRTTWSWRLSLRKIIIEKTREGPGQGLLLALLMGDKSKTSYATLNLVRRASLAHSLALSGLHLGFMISLAYGLVWLAGRIKPSLYLVLPKPRLVVLTALPLVLVYLWLGQARPSLLRAALMFFFWGFLILRGQNNVLGDGIFFALLIIVAINPLAVQDLGLQLSITAVAGIVIYLPLFRGWIKTVEHKLGWGKWLTPGLLLLAISFIANLVLLPLIVKTFGEVSPHLYFNLIWLPLLGGVVLPLGLIGLGLSLIPGLALPGGWLLMTGGLVLECMVKLLVFFDQQGWLSVLVPLRPLWPEMLGYWILILMLPGCWKHSRGLPQWLLLPGLALLLGPGLLQTAAGLKNRVQLELIDVGQGQAVCLQGKHQKRLLIDGGGSWNQEYDLGRFILSPALTWGRSPRVEQVVLSHDDYDHLRGLFYILNHYQVDEFLYNGHWPQGEDGQRLSQIIETRRIRLRELQAGDRIRLGPNLTLTTLHPGKGFKAEKDNDNSLVFRLIHAGQGLALLPADLEKTGLRRLCSAKKTLEAEVLVIPHHGSRSSFYPPLYSRSDPDLALVSCGYLNIYRFPHQKILDHLNSQQIPLLSTAKHGQIKLLWELPEMTRSITTRIEPQQHTRFRSVENLEWRPHARIVGHGKNTPGGP